jgi:ABC-type spermidine/putrescine transport system permease subunit II
MKYVFIFLIQIILLVLLYIPVILKFVWTFRWDDKSNAVPQGLKNAFKDSLEDFSIQVRRKH